MMTDNNIHSDGASHRFRLRPGSFCCPVILFHTVGLGPSASAGPVAANGRANGSLPADHQNPTSSAALDKRSSDGSRAAARDPQSTRHGR
ncbi:hypothetical protein LX36DRAFT_470935 [Colletotrichum falcatum]|nr:hypothetical protein LX36DRAFT_470935 [Colletotrichum falcatum]